MGMDSVRKTAYHVIGFIYRDHTCVATWLGTCECVWWIWKYTTHYSAAMMMLAKSYNSNSFGIIMQFKFQTTAILKKNVLPTW